MPAALSAFKKKNVIETYRRVLSIRETSLITKTSRNAVRSVLRKTPPDNLLINEAMATSRNMSELKKIPLINSKSKWNPIRSEIYRRLAKIGPITPLEPGCVDFITNTSSLMAGVAEELQIGDSVIATFKLDLLMSSYIEYKKLLHQASAMTSMDTNLPADKLARTANSYREAANRSLGRVLELLSELEGKKPTRTSLIQNNINLNLEDTVLKNVRSPINVN